MKGVQGDDKARLATCMLLNITAHTDGDEIPVSLVVGQLKQQSYEESIRGDKVNPEDDKKITDFFENDALGQTYGLPITCTITKDSKKKYHSHVSVVIPLPEEVLDSNGRVDKKALEAMPKEKLCAVGFELGLSENIEDSLEAITSYSAGYLSTIVAPKTISINELPKEIVSNIQAHHDNPEHDCATAHPDTHTQEPEDDAIDLLRQEAEKAKQYRELADTYGLEEIRAIALRAGVKLPDDLLEQPPVKSKTKLSTVRKPKK